MAASGVGAAVGYGVNSALGSTSLAQSTAGRIAIRTISGLSNGAVQSAITGHSPNWGAIAAESFGSALGDEVMGTIQRNNQSNAHVALSEKAAQFFKDFETTYGKEEIAYQPVFVADTDNSPSTTSSYIKLAQEKLNKFHIDTHSYLADVFEYAEQSKYFSAEDKRALGALLGVSASFGGLEEFAYDVKSEYAFKLNRIFFIPHLPTACNNTAPSRS